MDLFQKLFVLWFRFSNSMRKKNREGELAAWRHSFQMLCSTASLLGLVSNRFYLPGPNHFSHLVAARKHNLQIKALFSYKFSVYFNELIFDFIIWNYWWGSTPLALMDAPPLHRSMLLVQCECQWPLTVQDWIMHFHIHHSMVTRVKPREIDSLSYSLVDDMDIQ